MAFLVLRGTRASILGGGMSETVYVDFSNIHGECSEPYYHGAMRVLSFDPEGEEIWFLKVLDSTIPKLYKLAMTGAEVPSVKISRVFDDGTVSVKRYRQVTVTSVQSEVSYYDETSYWISVIFQSSQVLRKR